MMPICNSIEYNKNYSKTSGGLWQHYRDEPALTDADAIQNLAGNSVSWNYRKNTLLLVIQKILK